MLVGLKAFNVLDEIVDYQFPFDAVASVPYVNRGKDGDYESQFFNSFENTYVTNNLSKQNKKRLMFLPLVVEAGDGVKICITSPIWRIIRGFSCLLLKVKIG